MQSKFRRLTQEQKTDAPAMAPAKPAPPPPAPYTRKSETRPDTAAPPPPPAKPPVAETAPAPPTLDVGEFTDPISPRPKGSAREQAEEYLERLQTKLNRLAEDFAEGTINRAQFQKLFEHYQREKKSVEDLLSAADAEDDSFKKAIAEGQSVVIRKQNVSRAQGYAIYENDSGMPVTTLGKFELDPALVIPMLSSFRAATQEIFGAGLRSTAIEGGRWLCFVPGQYTTMLALFNTEPAPKQLSYIEGLHRLFEKANRHRLVKSPINADALLFPHEFFMGL